MAVPRIKLGSEGFEVSAQGLGCMGMSAFYGPPKSEDEMISLIHHAVSRGITFLDTSDFYGPHTNEILIGKALKGIRAKVQLATKFGILFEDGKLSIRGDPAYVRACCEGSLKRLGVDCIDLYYQHQVDRTIPIEVTIGEMKKLVEEGKIKYIGLSEASSSTIRRAHAIHPITAVQIEWSLWTRDIEKEIIPTCRELGIGIVPYSPLGRGFFSSGAKLVENLSDTDYRKYTPRLMGENLERNKGLFEKLLAIASRKQCTVGQLALSWVQHQGQDVVPIPGTTKVKNLEENIGACFAKLTPKEIKEIEDTISSNGVHGDRYNVSEMDYTWIKIGEMKKLVEEGKIKYIGLSEASPSTIRRAHAIHPITTVQLEWSLWTRDVEAEIVPTCRELGIGIVPYSPLGRGFFSSRAKLVENLSDTDYRKYTPRFMGENLEKNNALFEKLLAIALRKGCTVGQLALAWIQHQGQDVVPILGTTKVKNLEENINACFVKLAPKEMNEIEDTISSNGIHGDRYTMSEMDSTWMKVETPPLSSWKGI